MAEDSGVSNVKWSGDQFLRDFEDAIQDGLEVVGVKMSNEYSDVLNRQASNKTSGGKPSQPGQPPAKDTGTLARSISYQVGEGDVRVGVASGSPANKYALVMEYGSRGPIKPKTAKFLSWVNKATGARVFAKSVTIAPRPWLRPTFRKNYRNINEWFRKGVAASPKMREWLD